ncbi:MAG: TAT-variant-translocated molybdopterin oxidoreductase, partial [Phycisphaerae bacterium]
MTTQSGQLDLAAIRERLSGGSGPAFWRSLDELACTPEFEEFLHREFPDNASEWHDPVGRRTFLKLMAASLSMMGLAGCGKAPTEKIVPYVHPPEQLLPGKPMYYATAMPRGGAGVPVVVTSHMGRPTKIEGNEKHPASRVESGLRDRPELGATDAITQASILGLYDPDRSRTVMNAGQISTWAEFVLALTAQLEGQRARNPRGAGLRLLTGPVSSPTLSWLIRRLLNDYPGAKWHAYDPAGDENAIAGAALAFGARLQPIYRFDQADVIVSLDADFLSDGPAGVRYAHDFARRRKLYDAGVQPNRLYVAESTPTITGAAADHRLPIRPELIEPLARALAHELGTGIGGPADLGEPVNRWLAAAVRDLKAHKGRAVIVTGAGQPPIVHAFGHAMNVLALGFTSYVPPALTSSDEGVASLQALVKDMRAGSVETLVMIGCNPVYNAPADLAFPDALAKVPFRVHLGLYDDETAFQCHWHVPAAHYLESWGDVRAFDGSVTIIQPLIAPLYGGKTDLELLAAMLGMADRSGYDLLREHWQKEGLGPDFERSWQQALHDGVIPDARKRPAGVGVVLSGPGLGQVVIPRPDGLSIVFKPDPCVGDGEFANNAWLQELPKPLTTLTWDNAALISPATAERLGLANEEVVRLSYKGRSVNAPIWIAPG